jgi:wyosine [tRNA(Phe)-imidazoG37] synthetase (radical SAM superfamily)
MTSIEPTGSPTAFGPVPSRRLGRSLGIDNIPPKICDYGCVYCQVGRTLTMQTDRRTHYPPRDVVATVTRRLAELRELGEQVDFVTFVPTGEPTLDRHLGREIQELRASGLLDQTATRIAVITNGSLITRPDVRRDLAAADWVSLKVDAVESAIWRRINRPHGSLALPAILEGMMAFAGEFSGELATETMLVRDLNDGERHLRRVAAFLGQLAPHRAFVSVPTRPPARQSTRPPAADALNRAYQILAERLPRVELLLGDEGDAFSATGDAVVDLLGITAVHPMREAAVAALLRRTGADWTLVDALLAAGDLATASYAGDVFYLRATARPPTGDGAGFRKESRS